MTDADVDGAHIRTLLLTFFFRQMPELIERGLPLSSPSRRSTRSTRGKSEQYLKDERALEDYLIEQGVDGARAAADRRRGARRARICARLVEEARIVRQAAQRPASPLRPPRSSSRRRSPARCSPSAATPTPQAGRGDRSRRRLDAIADETERGWTGRCRGRRLRLRARPCAASPGGRSSTTRCSPRRRPQARRARRRAARGLRRARPACTPQGRREPASTGPSTCSTR